MLAETRLTVLDLTASVAGGFCAGLLARMGADVLRVESPGARDEPCPYVHVGKRRVVLDLDAPADRPLLDRLAARADVVVVDGPGAAGLVRPAEGRPQVLVVLNVAGASPGDEAPGSYEVGLWAESGLLDLARGTTGEPVPPPGFQASYQVGLHAAVAALGAVIEARRTGDEATIELEPRAVLSSLLLATGELDRSSDAVGPDDLAPREGRGSKLIRAADGDVFLNGHSVYARDFLSFARGFGLVGDDSAQSEDELSGSVARALRGWPRDRIVERAQEWRLPVGAVLSLEELARDEQIRHRGALVGVDDPHLGRVEIPWLPWTETAPSD